MGLIPFGGRRVGFWMPGRPERTLEEIPAELTPVVLGSLDMEGVSLIVAAADASDAPEWAVVIYASSGAAVVVERQDLMFIGLGSVLVLIDEEGQVRSQAMLAAGDELVSAWSVSGGLVLFTRTALVHLGHNLEARFRTELGRGQFQFIGADAGRWSVVQMGDGEDWDSLEIDASTGAVLSRSQ